MTNEYGQQPYPGHQPPIPGYGAPAAGSGYPQQQGQPGYPGTPPGGQPAYPGTPPGGQPVYAGQPYPQGPGGYGGGGYGPAPVEKPGTATGAAVLGFIQAGLTLITTVLITMGLFQVQGLANDVEVDANLGEMWVVVIAQFVGVVLLIFGAVQLLGGTGRMLFLIGAGLEIALSLYWIIRSSGVETSGLETVQGFRDSIIVLALGYAVMPIIALILAAGGGVGSYIQAKQAQQAQR